VIEDRRHVSRRLEQALIAAGERVVRAPGKSDQIDALAIARAVVKDGVDAFPSAYLDEQAMEIRLLSDHRSDLVAERTRMQGRVRWHLLALCPELEASSCSRHLVAALFSAKMHANAAMNSRMPVAPLRSRPR
jgi:transposase